MNSRFRMRVALFRTFKATRKEPLAEMLTRVYNAFHAAGLADVQIRFSFSDAPVAGSTSSVDRVLKRFPELERFVTTTMLPGMGSVRAISGVAEPGDFPLLHTIASGVPRSFPFHNVQFWLTHPEFGEEVQLNPLIPVTPGVMIGDSWWVSGRTRSLSAVAIVEGSPSKKTLPPLPDAVAAVFEACGKATKTTQMPLAEDAPGLATSDPKVAEKVAGIVRDYRARLAEVMDRAQLPHDLPPAGDAYAQTPVGQTSGPKKPALVEAFKPLGYSCKGESGTFSLTRRTPANLTIDISLDVGTWSNSLTGFYEVHGLGFAARLPLPVSKANIGPMQYPIGDAARWQRIVENLAALVKELDRTFVAEIETAAGPSPEWYTPAS